MSYNDDDKECKEKDAPEETDGFLVLIISMDPGHTKTIKRVTRDLAEHTRTNHPDYYEHAAQDSVDWDDRVHCQLRVQSRT